MNRENPVVLNVTLFTFHLRKFDLQSAKISKQ